MARTKKQEADTDTSEQIDNPNELEALRSALAPFVAHGRHLRKLSPKAWPGMDLYDQGAHVLVLEHFDRAVAAFDAIEAGQ